MDFVRLFATCQGRIGRAPYFLGFLALNIVAFVLSAILTVIYDIKANTGATGFLISLPFTIAYFCLAIKRAHDLGHSGLWLLGWIAVLAVSVMLIAGGAVMYFSSSMANSLGSIASGGPTAIAGGVLALSAIYQLGIKLTLFAGEDTDNEFGPVDNNNNAHTGRSPVARSSGGGANWMESALQTVEREAVSRSVQPTPRSAQPAANGFGRRTTPPTNKR